MSSETSPSLEDALWRHVLDAWFPRCLDREHGGYLCDFDSRWRPAGPQVKLLEFQARQTRVAALGCRLRRDDPSWQEACLHGFRMLRDVMWDADHGGWYALADCAGRPLEDGAKHAHGIAYAIQACLDVSRSIDEPEALELARAGFDWVDEHSWDRRHGGYWGWLRRDGSSFAESAAAAPRPRDHLGVPLGAKDLNTHGDMLETLTELHSRAAHGPAGEQLARLVGQFDRWVEQTGRLPLHFSAALEPIGARFNPGYELQASWRLPLARAVLGEPLRIEPVERSLQATAMAIQDRNGAILGADGRSEWWMQFEAVRSLGLHAAVDGGDATGLEARERERLDVIEARFLDGRRGGVHPLARRGLRSAPKGNRWKDGSHEAMCLASLLRFRTGAGRALTLADDPWP